MIVFISDHCLYFVYIARLLVQTGWSELYHFAHADGHHSRYANGTGSIVSSLCFCILCMGKFKFVCHPLQWRKHFLTSGFEFSYVGHKILFLKFRVERFIVRQVYFFTRGNQFFLSLTHFFHLASTMHHTWPLRL